MRKLLITIYLFTCLTGLAQSQESFNSILIPCEKAPTEAVKEDLPAQLSKWAVLNCTRYGQVLLAATGWIWHNPKTNAFIRIWSQPSGNQLEESVQNNYFKSLSFRKFSQEEAESANALLANELGATPQKVADAYTLEVVDAQERKQVVNFIRAEANVRLGTFWGWKCGSPCINPEVFMGFNPQALSK